MTIEYSKENLRTAEEMAAVRKRLEGDQYEWVVGQSDYTTFSRTESLERADNVYKAVYAETDADKDLLLTAYEQTRRLIHSAFDFYEGERSLERKIGRAFVVPMRSNRRNEDYASESIPLVPLFDPHLFAVDSYIRMKAMYGYPPFPLDTYLQSNNPQENGALVLAPIYEDMRTDFFTDLNDTEKTAKQALQLEKAAREILKCTTNFAHHYLGADVIGLGATLPGLTYFGNKLRELPGMEKLVTTTGHGGTVHMIVETAQKIMNETSIDSEGLIGVIGGAGSIGWSSTVTALKAIPDHEIVTYDKRNDVLGDRARQYDWDDTIHVAEDIREVLERTNIVITAVTTPIDLDSEEFAGLDLRGKVIIDDSQPGSFDMHQVETRGGKLVWVVGEDGSDSGFITRDGFHTNGVPYNYGNKSGLYGAASEFACGQEAAVIAAYEAYDRAIAERVDAKKVFAIGELFKRANVRVAPFQAFGRPVDIK